MEPWNHRPLNVSGSRAVGLAARGSCTSSRRMLRAAEASCASATIVGSSWTARPATAHAIRTRDSGFATDSAPLARYPTNQPCSDPIPRRCEILGTGDRGVLFWLAGPASPARRVARSPVTPAGGVSQRLRSSREHAGRRRGPRAEGRGPRAEGRGPGAGGRAAPVAGGAVVHGESPQQRAGPSCEQPQCESARFANAARCSRAPVLPARLPTARRDRWSTWGGWSGRWVCCLWLRPGRLGSGCRYSSRCRSRSR